MGNYLAAFSMVVFTLFFGMLAKLPSNQPIKVKLLKKVERESFSIPRAYWEYGWANRLNLNAKACLLINLAELGHKQQPPEWILSRPQITEKYGINRNALYSGMKALRNFNIINVKYSEIDEGYEKSNASFNRFLRII